MNVFESNSYFSVTDILMTEERIQCEISVVLPKLGFLSASSKTEHLERNTKLDLPLWLAESLCKHLENTQLNCEVPKHFKESYKEILRADACAVDLNKYNPYYYELGLRIPQLSRSEVEKQTEFLLQVFQKRFRIIMDMEQDPFLNPTQRNQLTSFEKKLLLQGNNSRKQLLNWLNRGVKQIKTSNVIDNLRKRKRIDNL